MNRAIAFDYQICFTAIEVCDVISELMLPPEFQTQELTISQELPEFSFRKGSLRFATRGQNASFRPIDNHHDIVALSSSNEALAKHRK